ncbi:hypothetical protein TB2_014698 [Malus domestica]
MFDFGRPTINGSERSREWEKGEICVCVGRMEKGEKREGSRAEKKRVGVGRMEKGEKREGSRAEKKRVGVGRMEKGEKREGSRAGSRAGRREKDRGQRRREWVWVEWRRGRYVCGCGSNGEGGEERSGATQRR